MVPALAILTVMAVVVLVAAERSGSPVRPVAKPVASAGFIAVAIAAGALDSAFGRWILAGLALSWFGDVFLLSKARVWFLGGLAAFLLAHVAYVGAFVVRGVGGWWLVTLAGLAVPAAAVGAWLWPKTAGGMRGPVLAYIGVITLMVATAAGTVGRRADGRLLVGAVAFYLSDLFVARERFVTPGYVNRLIGLPLYYGAQLLLAWAAGG